LRRVSPSVTWTWLINFKFVTECVFTNKTEQNTQKVLNVIVKAKEKGLSKRQLTRKTRYLKKKERNEIIEDLLEADKIEYVSLKNEGEISYVYRSK